MECSVDAPKKLKKVRQVAISHLPTPYALKAALINFSMWGRLLDVIT